MISPRAKGYPSSDDGPGGEAASSLAIVLRMVGHGKNVLEVGCANGQTSRELNARGNRVTGIDGDADAVAEARQYCEEAVVADLDARALYDVLPDRKYDVAVFDDVIERLRDPARVLRDARSFLSENGFVVISIPNVAHGNVRLSLLRGSFDFRPLDRAHMRFFTLRSLRELCIRSGYRIDAIERTKAPLFVETDAVPQIDERAFSRDVIDEIRRDGEHDTLQFVLRAVPVSDLDQLGLALAELAEVEARFADASVKIDRLELRLAELDGAAERSAELEGLVETLRRQLASAEADLAAAAGAPADVRLVLAEELEKYRDRDEALREALAEVTRLRSELLEASRSVGEASALRLAVDKAYAALSAQHEAMEAKLAERDGELARLRSIAAGAEARLAEVEESVAARERELSEIAEERGAALARLAHEHSATLAAARAAEREAAESLEMLRAEFESARAEREAAAAESLAELELVLEERAAALATLEESLAETVAARDELEARLTETQERAQTRERELIHIAEERSGALTALAQEHSSALADARADALEADEALADLRRELEALSAARRELEEARAADALRLAEAEEIILSRAAADSQSSEASEPLDATETTIRVVELQAQRDELAARLAEAEEVALARETAIAEAAARRESIAARELELVDLQREVEAEREALASGRAEAEALEELQLSLAARAVELMDLQREAEAERDALARARSEAEESRAALAQQLAEAEASVEHLWESIAERELELAEVLRQSEEEREALTARLAVAEASVDSLWESIGERESELIALQRAAEAERDFLAELLAEAGDVAIAREAAFEEELAERAKPNASLTQKVARLESELERIRGAHRTTVELFKRHVDGDVKAVRLELAQVDGMIRVVQRSWAWSLKMLIVRVLRRLPGGRARV